MSLTRNAAVATKPLDAFKRVEWGDLIHLSAELASTIMGVPIFQAEARLHHARKTARRNDVGATVADFQRCPLAEVKAPTTLTFKLISNKRIPDEAEA